MTSKRLKRIVAVAVSAACALLSVAGTADAGAARARGAGPLRDLQPGTAQPTDGATAQVVATESDGTTTVTIKVQALDHAAAGMTLGAHVHVGSCVAGNGTAAGLHYNAGGVASDETEVWLDFTINANGTARAQATVPFTIAAGAAASVVIHAEPTHPGPGPIPAPGSAGIRLACLPVQF
ncbi:MAG: superoxide dismutase family protein [Ilumatobacteraceae bacterium]